MAQHRLDNRIPVRFLVELFLRSSARGKEVGWQYGTKLHDVAETLCYRGRNGKGVGVDPDTTSEEEIANRCSYFRLCADAMKLKKAGLVTTPIMGTYRISRKLYTKMFEVTDSGNPDKAHALIPKLSKILRERYGI